MWHQAKRILTLGTLLLGSTTWAADSGMLNAALGRWIDTEAAPALAETLANHPRFKGETVRVVSMRDGRPLDRGSRLHQAVEQHLTQRLLKYSGVRIAWDKPAKACGAPEQVSYLLGIEIERDGSRSYKTNIGVIDVSESVWVSGVNLNWQGQLSADERAAFNRKLDTAPRGTIDSPLPVADSAQIADLLQQHMRCALPDGLEGPVYLKPAEPGSVAHIASQLGSRLAITPFAAMTRSASDAHWILSLQAEPAAGKTHQLLLLLEDAERNVTQQVAALYVADLSSPASTESDSYVRVAATAPNEQELLTGMRLSDARHEGICDRSRARVNTCVEVSFELLEPAYLFVFSTQARQLKGLSCEIWLDQSPRGERRYRLRVPPSLNAEQPSAGVYAIAVLDRAIAKKLDHHLRSPQGMCGGSSRADLQTWLNKLDVLIDQETAAVDWQTIQLAHTTAGVQQL